MKVLAPIDGSDPSARAVRFAAEFAQRYDATLDVVHFRKEESETGRKILERAEEILDEEDVDTAPRVELDPDLEFRPGNRVGERVLQLVKEGEYDHVIMGHHGVGMVDEAILGSATKRVSEAGLVPLTIVP